MHCTHAHPPAGQTLRGLVLSLVVLAAAALLAQPLNEAASAPPSVPPSALEQHLWAMDTRMLDVSSRPAVHPDAELAAPVIWADEYPPPAQRQTRTRPTEAAPPPQHQRAILPPPQLISDAATADRASWRLG